MSLKTVYGTIDSFTNQDRPNVNHGPDSRLMLKGQTSHKKYGWVLFAKPYPPGALILDATMTVTLAASWPGTTTITVRRITASWKESRITWNNQPATSGTNVATKVVTGGVKDEAVEIDLT